MAWTAKFIRYDAGSNAAQVEFTDGVTVIPKTFYPPPGITSLAEAAAWLKPQSAQIIGMLTTRSTLETAIPNTDVTPDPAPAPDPDQSLKEQFTSA
jgi:hypothetical protein